MEPRQRKTLLFLIIIFCILFSASIQAEESSEPALQFEHIKTIYREDLTEEFGDELVVQMRVAMGPMADMFKMKVWIYEIKEDSGGKEKIKEFVDTVLEKHPWPPAVNKIPLQENDFSHAIENLLNSYEEELSEAWGSDWPGQARNAVGKYKDRRLISKSYIYSEPDTGITYSISVNSPFGSIRKFKLYDGVYIIITRMLVQF